MKKFPFTIIRKERLADIHHRNRTLSSVNDSIGDTLIAQERYIHQLEQQIGNLADKCSRVGLSKLENEIAHLRQIIVDTAMVDNRRIIIKKDCGCIDPQICVKCDVRARS